MLNAMFVALKGASLNGVARTRDSMARQGFVLAQGYEWDEGALQTWTHPCQREVVRGDVRTPAGVACCVGSVWYRGRFGDAALTSLLGDINAMGRCDESELRGNFALFVHTPQQCLLMNDLLGFLRIYASADGCFFSTSWLATCAYAGAVEIDEAAVVEYVLLGASHSDQTVACGITTLPLAKVADLAKRQLRARRRPWDEGETWSPATLSTGVERIGAHLETVFAEIAAAFPARTRAALSGGFDSRLIVAGLLACGNRPELFVYGGPASEDVRVAQAVAESLDASLLAVDKQVLDKQRPLPDLERMVGNALFFDGLASDGIYDAGVDQETRLAQNAGGWLALNGGGGEIFRNYFHLPDRPLRSIDLVRTFYRGFDRTVFRRKGALVPYEDGLAASICRAIGMGDSDARRILRRDQVELAYPLFRCHHWMGVNNSIAVRHGHYVTPLVTPTAIRLAFRLPLDWKNAGKLESALVTRFHRGIASQVSAHGFRFTDGPDWKAKVAEWTTRARPVFTRPLINAVARRARKQTMTPMVFAHCRSLLPGEWRLDPILDLSRLPGDRALARALAVEVVWRKLLA